MLSLEVPICSTSLGNVSMGILLEMFRRGLTPNIFPIGQIDVSQFVLPQGFSEWLNDCLGGAFGRYKRTDPGIRIFQIQGSIQRISDKPVLYCPHETSTLTDIEQNILSQYDRVLVPSNYNKSVFTAHGIPAEVCPNFYEKDHIFPVKVHKDKNVTVWGVFGKMEKRKNTIQIIKNWCRRFGKNKNHRLILCVYNMFLFQNFPPEQRLNIHKQFIQQSIGHELPWNVELYGFMPYSEYNQLVNVTDIDLSGLSGSEGMNLPFLNSRCLGKRGVSLNAHAHQDYADNENSVLVEPNGVEDIRDDVFFTGNTFNVGTKFLFDDDEAISAMEEALARPDPNPTLAAELRQKFDVSKTIDILLS